VNARGDSWVKILYFVPFFWTINPTQPLLHWYSTPWTLKSA
jgi:hypothetical protein